MNDETLNTYWNIDSGNGNSLAEGLSPESYARKVAQRTANERGESVYLYEVGLGDGESEVESEEIVPETDSGLDSEDGSAENREAASRAPGARSTVELDDEYIVESDDKERTMSLTKYDLTVQWTDESREPGYRETCESISVAAASVDAAIEAARALRPNASRVQVHGVAGTGIAFQGRSFVWQG